METIEPTVTRIHDVAATKRVSWAAIFAGTFAALAIMALLGSLGVAIGATTIDPQTGDTPSMGALGTGAGIWWVVSGIIALFVGGWAASRGSEIPRQVEGIMHGIVTWSFTTIISTVLMMTLVGLLISGAMRVMGTAVSYAARGTTAVAGQLGGMLTESGDQRGEQDDTWQEVRREAREILRQTGKRQLQPENIERDLSEARSDLEEAAKAQTSQEATNELEQALSRLYSAARETIAAADREAVVNVLAARTDMSRQEAQAVVDRWASRFEGTWQQTTQRVQEAAAGAAEATAEAVASAAWWTFFYLLLTALAAVGGGYVGVLWPRREVVVVAEGGGTPVTVRHTR